MQVRGDSKDDKNVSFTGNIEREGRIRTGGSTANLLVAVFRRRRARARPRREDATRFPPGSFAVDTAGNT